MKTLPILSLCLATQATVSAQAIRAGANDKNVAADATSTATRALPLEPKKPKKVLNQKHQDMRKMAVDRHLNKDTADEAGEDRKLKKTKTGKLGSGWWNGDTWGSSDQKKWDDDWRGDNWDNDGDDHWSDDGHGMRSGKSNKNGDWSGGWKRSGKSNKNGDWGGGWKSGKSDKGGDWSGDWGSNGSNDWSGGYGGYCNVTVTNLSFQQAFSELFVMVHAKQVTKRRPIYTFGNRTNSALGNLAQDLETSGMFSRYQNFPGVRDAFVINDFGTQRKYLNGGSRKEFKIRPSSNYNRISIAAGFPFANDGAIVLQSGMIYDGAEYFLPALDVGVEANLQTCWSVPAEQEDFPSNSACAKEDKSDLNNNAFAGENFVGIHRGMSDLDDKNDLDQILLLECSDAGLDKANDDTRFVMYFMEEGYDDDWLLCKAVAGSNCNFRGDDDFRNYVQNNNDDLDGSDDVLIQLVKKSSDFDDFCDRVSDINKELESLFKTLEAVLFDFRNPVAQVEIDCY